MSGGTVRIYCSSEDSKIYYPNNTPVDFTIRLEETLHIGKYWVCSLSDIAVPIELKDSAYLCCDLCDTSLTSGSGRLPILRRIPIRWSSILPLVYIPVKKEFINTIHFFLRDVRGRPLTKLEGVLECTLTLKPDTPWA
jgi:hypothetical protein